jgi:bacillolysin
MKRKNYNQLFIMVLLSLPNSIMGQISQNNTISYQKNMKFDTFKDIDQAKEDFKSAFKLDNRSTFVKYESNIDKVGGLHEKYQQYFNGIKVEYGTMIVHSKNGSVMSINGELYNPGGLNLVSNLSSKSAFEKAMSHVGAQRFLWDDAEASKNMQYKKPEGELVIFPVLENGNTTIKMAYKFDIYATIPVSRGFVYINAQNGDFLYTEPIIKHYNSETETVSGTHDKAAKSSSVFLATGNADTRYSGSRTIETRAEINGTFTLNDNTRNVHTYNAQNAATNSDSYLFTTVDFVDDDNVWTASEFDNAARDNAALDAHWGAMNVYDFWASLGRNSYNDGGAEIRSYVHLGTNYFNAFWNGSVMSYGDGSPNPLTSIDVVAHEIAHAVTTTTANLVYARESGAMNEGFSDIFGAAIEFYAKGTGTDTNPNAETWLIGEDFGSAFRSMSDPKSKGDPDTYNGANYIDASSSCIPWATPNDGCGVHTNSGVLNHWFYISVAGEAGTNDAGDIYNVTGIGMSKAQEIAYLMLRDYLSPNATYMDARNAAIDVAISLYGSNTPERQAVQDAFYAVNLGEAFIPYATDLKLVAFSQLVDITCGDPIIAKIKVRNTGTTNAISTIQVNYSIDGVAQTPFIWNGTLAIDTETEITLPTLNEPAIKSYNLIVNGVVAGDGDSTNNNLSGNFRVNKADNNPTVVNDFEQILVDYWLTYNKGGGSNLWTIGSPNKTNLNTVTSGTFAQVTRTTADYPNETKAYLISPCFDLTPINSPKMKFNMAFQLQENFDILYVEYSTDLVNWTILGSASDPNWYNSNRIFESGEVSTDCQNCPGAQWTGSSNVFTEYSYDLVAFKNEPNINFRFVFHSDASGTDEGVVIDDFVIENATLGVNDLDKFNKQILVYPNPSANSFTFSFESDYNTIDIDVFDITGKMVLSKKDISKRKNSYVLDMSNYSKGLYFSRIIIEDGVTVVKKLILK